MKLKRFVAIYALAASCATVWAQTTVKGVVTDAETGIPLSGANIRVDHSLQAATTDAQGRFSLKDLPEGKQTLRITHVGYEQTRYTVDKSTDNARLSLQPSSNNLSQVVVTGTGTHRRMTDSPIPVSVITGKDLREAHVNTLEEALTKLTSSFSFTTSGMGTESMMNGLKSDYILFLVNGRKMISDDALQRINMANVKRIEIVHGASSILYGSDAVGGVVNIITDDSKNRIDVANHIRIAGYGRITEGVDLDINAGKFSSYTSYQYNHSDGWQLDSNEEVEDKKTKEVKIVPTQREAFTGYRTHNLSQQLNYAFNDKLSLYAQGSYYDFLNNRLEQYYNYNLYHSNYNYGAGAKYILNPKAYLDADYHSEHYRSAYDYIKELKNKAGEVTQQKGDRITRKELAYRRANVRGIFRLGANHKLTAGLEYVHEELESESDNINNRTLYTAALYAQDQWTVIKNLEAVIGLRYIYNEAFKSYATSSLSAMYKFGDFRARLSYASGFRTPTLHELYATDLAKTVSRYTLNNPDLKPEKSDNFSLNAEYAHHRFSFSATAYVNRVRNMINFQDLTGEVADKLMAEHGVKSVRQRNNIDRARVKGLNLQLNADLGLGFSIGAGYSWTDARNALTDSRLDKSIKHAGHVNARWGKQWDRYGLAVNLMGRGQSERYSETYDYESPGFFLWDLNTTHQFRLRSFLLQAGLGVENIFDWSDARPWNTKKPYATMTPGRSFHASLTLKFKS